MRKLLLLFFIISSISFSQSYKKVKIYVSNQIDINTVAQIGVDVEDAGFDEDKGITCFVNENEFQKLLSSGLSYDVLIDDWEKHYKSYPVLTSGEKESARINSKDTFGVEGFDYGSMGGYYTFDEIIAELDNMRTLYPNLITAKQSLGTSIEGRDIWMVKISDNADLDEDEAEAGFDALIHAREPQSMASLIYFMYYLLENYDSDPTVKYLVDNREIYCVPCVNPDGFEYNRSTNPSGGGMWRKNRRNSGSGNFGVDLNRNYSYQWGYDNVGSSNDPSTSTYRGTAAFSEPESQAVSNFISTKQIKTYFNMHSYSNAYLYPWGYVPQFTPDSTKYREFAADLTSYNGYEYGNSFQVIGYTSNGSVRDWLYGEQTDKNKIYGYTLEIGSSSDGFWPPQSRIFPLAQENVLSNMYNAWVAGAYVALKNYSFDQEYYDPSDSGILTANIKNKGLATAYNTSISATSLSSEIIISNSTVQFDSIMTDQIVNSSPINFTIQNTAVIGESYKILIESKFGTTTISSDTISLKVGTPIVLFQDDENLITTNWTLTSSSASEKWEATTASASSGSESYTDSKVGQYSNDITNEMQLITPIDLSGAASPVLWFDTKYEIESDWDYGQLLISTNNGSNWTPLEGTLTNAGTGSFQPTGEPVYDGTQSNWTLEEIDLSGFVGSSILLKFVIISDGGVTKDGWYVDNIRIVYYGQVPVELLSFDVNSIDNKVILSWITATEDNNLGFEIEKSVNKTEWQKSGFIKGNGTTAKQNQYKFVDENPFTGKSFYRLVQVDYDGTKNYYDEIEFDNLNDIKFSLLQNYPNPFNPETTISYSIDKQQNIKLELFDVLGKKVKTLVNKNVEAGNYNLKLNASKLPSGTYFYRLSGEKNSIIKKLLLLK